MGLDQRIWAEIQINGVTKKVAIHYWRKDYEIDEWFFSRLPKTDQQAIEAGNETVWSCDVTAVELGLLEGDNYALALQLDFDPDLLTRCQWALEDGFTLSYCRDS
jgi:hypothetical protein